MTSVDARFYRTVQLLFSCFDSGYPFGVPSTLPQKEKEIGARLRQWRTAMLIPRTLLARKVGIGSERLASYESGRAPLKFGVFLALWKHYDLNPEWLATNKGSPSMRFAGFDKISTVNLLDPKERFSEAFDKCLRPVFEQGLAAQFLPTINRADEWSGSIVSRIRRGDAKSCAEAALEMRSLFLSHEFLKDEMKAGTPLALPKFEGMQSLSPMNRDSLLARLRHRLERATSGRGMKTQLAKEFGVSQATVTQWINGSAGPSAGNTLALLEWVEREEAKQQNKVPDRALTRPGRTTRRSKITSHEKAKSDHPKKS